MKLVVVTGSRNWTDHDAVRQAFARLDNHVHTLLHGDCEGLDRIAEHIALVEFGWQVIRVPAMWEREGKHAGPKRNDRMATIAQLLSFSGWNVCCLAFPLPGSKGTWGCVRRLKEYGFDVEVVKP